MKQKINNYLLGVFDLILSYGAINIGVSMIGSNSGIFTEYPKEWLSKVPFVSWVAPGIIGILVFGIGNIIAAMFSILGKNNKSWYMSAIMGCIFFVSMVAQVLVLGEAYLATGEFFILSIIQLCLSGYAFSGYRKDPKSSKI